VIVPTLRLTDHGRRCLERLLALAEPLEILFVPDGEEDVPAGVSCLPSGPVPVGAKRQLGLERARGEFVALIDDDAYPHPSWLANALAGFEEGVAAVTGPTLTPADEPHLGRLGGRVYASPLVGGPHRWRYAPAAARDVDDAPSVNLVLRREDALAVRLDSPFYPGDDTVVCDRLIARGRRIRAVPGAIVYHSRRPLWRPHLRQLWRFGRRRGAFARRLGGNSRRLSYFLPSALVLGLAFGWLLPGPLFWAWAVAAALYAAAVVVAGASRNPLDWARVSGAIALSHLVYGVGFILGIAGVPLPEER